MSLDEKPTTAAEPSPFTTTAAKAPAGYTPVMAVGPVLALVAAAAGVVLIRDVAVWEGWLTGPSWTGQTVRWLQSLSPMPWLLVLGVVVALVGLWLVVIALRPRPRHALALADAPEVFLSRADVSRIAQARAERVDGVFSARASTTSRTLTVTVTGTAGAGSDSPVADEVRSAVTEAVSPLASPPTVKVTLRRGNP